MKININLIKNYLLWILLFCLPWQTRLIYQASYIGNTFWEYGSLSLYGTEILLGAIIFLFLIEKVSGNFFNLISKHFNKQRFIVIIGSLLSVSMLYLLTSVNPAVTWQYLNWLIYGICLIFVILESRLHFKNMLLAIWSGGLLQAVFGIWQFFNQYIPGNKWFGVAIQDPKQLGVAVIEVGEERWLRAYGAFGWPNSLGIYLAAIFVLGIILVMQEKNRLAKIALLTSQIIVLFGLFFSFARGAWLATIIGVLFLIWKRYKDEFFWQQLAMYGLSFLILLLIFRPLVFSRLDLQNRLEKMSLEQRVNQWSQFEHVLAVNYLAGSGPGNYTTALYNLYPGYFVLDLKPVHNIFLLFIAEWGIVGLCLLMAGLFYTEKIINWSFAPLVVLLVAGLFDHWSISTFTGLIFFCLMIGLSIKYKAIDTKVTGE